MTEAKVLMEAREAEELPEDSYHGTGRIGKVTIQPEKSERDRNVKEKALQLSGYQCEVDLSNDTLKTKGRQFKQGHHLFPRGAHVFLMGVVVDFAIAKNDRGMVVTESWILRAQNYSFR